MLTTIVFALAISLSWVFLANYIHDMLFSSTTDRKTVKVILLLMAIILWSWLYYLSH